MDTSASKTPGRAAPQGQQVDVQATIRLIQQQMPQTYADIQRRAQQDGNEVYAWVRRAIKGEPNCFWAVERGHVVGTPFNAPDVQADVARLMVVYGCAHLVMWPPVGAPGTAAGG